MAIVTKGPYLVIDCPEPLELARFYADLLGWRVHDGSTDEWANVEGDRGELNFQRVEGYRAPEWPEQVVPQQMHLDVIVDDLDEAEAATLALGATKHEVQPGETFRVFLDPAGHPFCLCVESD